MASIISYLAISLGTYKHYSSQKRHIEIEDIEYSTNSIINITSSFGEKVQYIQTNDLQYVTIDSKFSGLKLYFDQATIQNQATIEIDGNFTGIQLYVPKEWNVQSHVRAFFGGVDEKDSHHQVAILH